MIKYRMAVIGCNNMGTKHINVLRQNFSEETELAGILNSSPESSRRKAAELAVPYFDSLDEITPQRVDAVIVCVPGPLHAAVGEVILNRKIPCLMEKPLATTLPDCERLIAAAAADNTLLLAGHTENYNPAVQRLIQELHAPLTSVRAVRTSRNAENATGVTAVQELMIHDLAIIYSLLGDKPENVSIGKSARRSWENHAVVAMEYPGGCLVRLEALREDVPIERTMDLEDAAGNLFHIDFLERRLLKNGKILTEGGNSLVEEHRNFLACLKGEEKPLTGGREAASVLGLCLRAEAQIPVFEAVSRQIRAESSKTL